MPETRPDCIFCAIVAGDSPAEIVDSDEHTVTLMDINPATIAQKMQSGRASGTAAAG